MLRRLVISVIAGCLATPGMAADLSAARAFKIDPEAAAAARALHDRFEISPEIAAAARSAYQATQAPAWQHQMRQMVEGVFPEQAERERQAADDGRRLYLFVSSSVPLPVLRRYVAQLEGLPGAAMILRGFVDGGTRIGPTVAFIDRVLRKDPACEAPSCPRSAVPILVDPVLFRRYGIDRAPALAVASGVMTDGTCSEGNTEKVRVATSAVIYGDAPVEALLERLEEGSAGTVAAQYRELIVERQQ